MTIEVVLSRLKKFRSIHADDNVLQDVLLVLVVDIFPKVVPHETLPISWSLG